MDISGIEHKNVEPPLKPDTKDKSVEFKYFNTKQQSLTESIMPKEKMDKIEKYKEKFKDFDQIGSTAPPKNEQK